MTHDYVLFKASKDEIRLHLTHSILVNWKDFATILCLALTILAVAALVTAAENFVIVRGKVVGAGNAFIDSSGEKIPTRTLTVIIENSDRVFRIQAGTSVEYAISDEDASLAKVGSEVELFISSHQSKARIISIEGRSPI